MIMDFSKFLDENFDIKEWVNAAFKSQKDPTVKKDQYATTMVMKLQMFIQEVNNVIEEASQQAVQNLPRVIREIEAVKQEASLLQDQMRMVKEDIQKVEHDTSQSMQMLLQLDNIKSRMQAASNALKEADNWSTLSADIEEVFDSQDINVIAEKLVGMQQSLQILVDVPDYKDRCQHLEKLKNRLEAMLSPQVVAAFNAKSLESAQVYVKIFSNIDRLPQLYKYYHKCHKTQLLNQWKTIVETNQEETVVEWLSEFYDQMFSTWHTQVQWCSQVFKEPEKIVSQLLTETLAAMEPSIPYCIANFLESKSSPLDALMEVLQVSERFAKSIETALESHAEGPLGSEYSATLAMAIYAPYRSYVQRYENYEEAALSTHLNNIPLDKQEVMDSVRVLGESVNKLFSAANKGNERCLKLTHGCGYISLLQALKNYFINYGKEFRRVLTNLREKIKMGDNDPWALFQHSLRIIQTCGELILHVEELDDSLMSNILHSIGKQTPSTPKIGGEIRLRVNPFHQYTELLIEKVEDREALELLVTKLEEEMPSVLEVVKKDFSALSVDAHRFAFDIVFAQIKEHLQEVSTMEIWTSASAGGALTADLPTFSLSPQEYITQVGQYLMTIPQHLEPFTTQDNPALLVAVKHGKLPYTEEQESFEQIADLWLESMARGAMHMYCEEILKIPEITAHASRQLVTDIDYLSNVLDDLGLQPSETVKNIETLLKCSKDNFDEESENMPRRLVSVLKGMRGL
ncbi:conserved oligomeric Golgi complex subunit 7 [Lingula anatina]|uniref:Conserved oligomeric Golgi complex subunit 7 n=1 Tax=Lingula anatina TaxID=7574 RepID=A0A1S3K2A2_LINAN|nr:conserved oligomeric Golgi complex subunit 7 [Lingula anatina]|eukprot:XP_013416401.1 conserved oligomeric Golgi complex subunit 7 [Lingula anatina]